MDLDGDLLSSVRDGLSFLLAVPRTLLLTGTLKWRFAQAPPITHFRSKGGLFSLHLFCSSS